MFQWMSLIFVQKKSNADIKVAGAKGGLVLVGLTAWLRETMLKSGLQDVVTEHFNSDMSSVDAANALADAALDNI